MIKCNYFQSKVHPAITGVILKSTTLTLKKEFGFSAFASILASLLTTAIVFSPWIQRQVDAEPTYTGSDISWIFVPLAQILTPIGPMALFALTAMTVFCVLAWVALTLSLRKSRR
jgi:hypothetical protein